MGLDAAATAGCLGRGGRRAFGEPAGPAPHVAPASSAKWGSVASLSLGTSAEPARGAAGGDGGAAPSGRGLAAGCSAPPASAVSCQPGLSRQGFLLPVCASWARRGSALRGTEGPRAESCSPATCQCVASGAVASLSPLALHPRVSGLLSRCHCGGACGGGAGPACPSQGVPWLPAANTFPAQPDTHRAPGEQIWRRSFSGTGVFQRGAPRRGAAPRPSHTPLGS